MRKWIVILLIFATTFMFVGCKPNNDDDDDFTSVKAQKVEIDVLKNEIEINEELTLTAVITPDNAKQDVNWSSNNPDIATVSTSGVVKGVGSGTVEITASAKTNSNIKTKIVITVVAPVVDPVSVSISGKNSVTKGSNITLTSTVLPEQASQSVLWESSNPNIASVVNGKVTGVELGSVVITATVPSHPTIKATHNVEVTEYTYVIPGDGPQSITISGEPEMIVGKTMTLSASVLPTGVSQNVIWSADNESIATVSPTGVVTAVKEGTVYITATSAVDEEVFETLKIRIKPKPFVEEYPNMEGYQIVILGSAGHTDEHYPFSNGYSSLDKSAKMQAWSEMEKNFNCTMVVNEYPPEAPWGPGRYNWMISKATLGLAEADIYISTTVWLKTLVDGGAVLDTLSYYQKYGQNMMPSAQRASSTYRDGLYTLLSGGVAGINVDQGIFYNVALIESLDLPSPAKLFNEGKWSYTDFLNYVKSAKPLLQEGQSVLSGQPNLYWAGMVNAGGVKFSDTITLQNNFDHPYAIQAASILRDIYSTVGWGTIGYDAMVTSFNEGNSIFQAAEYWFVRSNDRWPSTLWDENGLSRFGYVPFPYPDNMNKENTRTVGYGGQCYMLAAGRDFPPSVNANDIYRAFTEMTLRTRELMQEDPTFSEDNVMRQFAQRKLDDPESVEAVIFFKNDKVVFDPTYSIYPYITYLSPALQQIVVNGADFFEQIDAIKPTYFNRMLELYS